MLSWLRRMLMTRVVVTLVSTLLLLLLCARLSLGLCLLLHSALHLLDLLWRGAGERLAVGACGRRATICLGGGLLLHQGLHADAACEFLWGNA